jgi:hypothetical protein
VALAQVAVEEVLVGLLTPVIFPLAAKAVPPNATATEIDNATIMDVRMLASPNALRTASGYLLSCSVNMLEGVSGPGRRHGRE